MSISLQGDVGPQVLSDGVSAPLRLGRGGEGIFQQLHGRYYEAVKRGNVYAAFTAVGGVAPGTALGTTAAHALYNPAGSGVELSILEADVAYVSGTLGAGHVAHAGAGVIALPTGTAIVPVNLKTLQATGSKALPFTTATLASAPTYIKPAFNLSAAEATDPAQDKVDGVILVPQGGVAVLHGVASAGSGTPLVIYGYVWEEIPVGA